MNNSSSITAGDAIRPLLVNAKKVMNFDEIDSAVKAQSGYTGADSIANTESLVNQLAQESSLMNAQIKMPSGSTTHKDS